MAPLRTRACPILFPIHGSFLILQELQRDLTRQRRVQMKARDKKNARA
jgi:hypothetical protein